MDIYEEIIAAKKTNLPLVLATVVESLGSAPREEGAHMLIKSDGTIVGTIGGGAVEKMIIDEALAMMNAPAPKLVHYDLKNIGMVCGGGMSVFLEPLRQLPKLIIFGGGHIGSALSRIAKMLDFTVTVVDNRPEFANMDRLPWVDAVIADEYEAVIELLTYDDNTYLVILTHKHAHDFEVLQQLIHKPVHYLGMIGSKTKVIKAIQQLREKGISEDKIKRIHSPVGVGIGANTPVEIAVSIAGELVAVRNDFETPR